MLLIARAACWLEWAWDHSQGAISANSMLAEAGGRSDPTSLQKPENAYKLAEIMPRYQFILLHCRGEVCAFLTSRNAPSSRFAGKAQVMQEPHL